MPSSDNRQISRDSLFVLVNLRLDGVGSDHRIKMRNLSAGGMMAEGSVPVANGQIVWIELRNLGWTEGSVAWVQGNRFGVAFRDEIDPALARAPESAQVQTDLLVRRPAFNSGHRNEGPLRKV